MESVYKRRRGIEWESCLYKRLINYLRSNQMCIDNINISIEDVKKLSVEIFPKHGHRKKYQDNVLDFLQQYSDIITKHVSAEPNNTISAPKLKLWLAYKEKLVSAMINANVRMEITQFVKDHTYKIPYNIRRIIICNIYNIQDEQCEQWMIQYLINVLSFNRQEICDELKKLLQNCSTISSESLHEPFTGFADDEVQKSKSYKNTFDTFVKSSESLHEPFTEFADDEVQKSKSYKNTFDTFVNKQCVNDKEVSEIILTNMEHVIPETKTSHKDKTSIRQRKCTRTSLVELRDKITQNAIQFFELKDDESEQLLLLKKLIILSIVTENNPDFNRFMSSIS
ncbi:uncharacterized protein LOC100679204 isoform X2 [Nasonia vitripennis]|uniref:Uncharacterized protein n=1 Tax=Nasonia vitripennis TaxID=7425 RepID=A0A7M7PX12_NASVI|nr:uncharacterized protein LOC100679204 isoform X2 [Nasonia vitripennis]